MMVVSQEAGDGPYWYARVLGIFHADILHVGPLALNLSVQHMEFLWVCWFGIEPGYRSGSHFGCLLKVGFVPDTDPCVFGSLDPSLILHGCHLVPAFAGG